MKSQSELPLLEIEVLELGGVLAVPYASMLLSDMGAEVIKVEKPNGGDDTRHWSPPSVGGQSAYFLGVNRGKKSVAIDLKTDEGKEILKALVRKSDVLIENFSRGSLEKLGMSCGDMRKLNPRLITCSIKGYARGTPKENDPGYDLVIQARSGLMSITGEDRPTKVGVAVADIITGLFAMNGIIAALYARERDGGGGHVEVPLLSAMVAALPSVAQNYLVSEEIPKRLGNAHPNIVPYQSFRGKDKLEFVVAVGNDRQWQILCRLLKREDLNKDTRFATNAGRVAHRTELVAMLEQEFLTRPRDEWVGLLESGDLPVGPIQDLAEVFNDPNVLMAGMLTRMEHPTAGEVWAINSPIDFGNGNSVRRTEHLPPPLLGEHTDSILLSIGYSEENIADLREKRVIA